ncbi:MAG: agmatine deiminase family protein [Gammaproteobacteria bacterium]|nr:agmatine deiminase family protein [Gammaproteobacteria bacterium]
MPAEWRPHERCWMAWPCRSEFWGDNLAATRQTYASVANAIAEFEPVTMLAPPGDAENCRKQCSAGVTVLPVEIDDSWMRDNGPNFVLDDAGNLGASIFHFNAWGKKHEPWGKDAAVGHRIAEYLGIRTFSSTIYMEGGGINVDGEGTVLVTEQNVLNENRNPGLGKDEAARILGDALGVDTVVWCPGDPDDKETDGHIDGIACFVEPGRVLVEICPAEGTERYDNMQANLDAIRNATDSAGRRLKVEIIEEAYEADRRSDIFASSYINYYIANGAIVMPSFGIDRDGDARKTLSALYPDREIVQVDISDIALGGGGIHCITQQQPVSNLGDP